MVGSDVDNLHGSLVYLKVDSRIALVYLRKPILLNMGKRKSWTKREELILVIWSSTTEAVQDG